MEKAIEIKRRAQRCILNGDLTGALAEYEKLVALGDPDPYYCVLLADLLYKMGSAADAQRRYLEAIEGYARAGLYKNGIAVCKKLSRLSLASIDVPKWLAQLYSQDGLETEAGFAYQQLAEILVKHDRLAEARAALQSAIAISPDAARLYERLAELEVLADDSAAAGTAWSDAADRYARLGQEVDASRCRTRIAQLTLGATVRAGQSPAAASAPAASASAPAAAAPAPARTPPGAPRTIDMPSRAAAAASPGPAPAAETPAAPAAEAPAAPSPKRRVGWEQVLGPPADATPEPAAAPVGDTEADAPEVVDAPVAPSAPLDLPRLELAPMFEMPDTGVAAADAADDAGAGTVYEIDAGEDGAGELGAGRVYEIDVEEAAAESLPPAAALEVTDDEAEAAESQSEAPVFDAAPAAIDDTTELAPQAAPVQTLEATPQDADTDAVTGGDGMPKEFVTTLPRRPRLEIQRFGDTTPAQPALAANASAAPEGAPEPQRDDPGLAQVSMILAEAQTHFHAGDRDAATIALIRAAQAYDQMGRYDSAVAIYRSLGQSPDVSLQLMMLWLKNCQRRDDRTEAARVACDLGDRALNDGDVPSAKEWFQRARAYDDANELALRRLKAMDAVVAQSPADVVAAMATATAVAPGHLDVRTGHDEPVVIDLGTLIEEFQRAVEPELASDPQGHYDLGMSYREMGLTEQAVTSLRIAAKAPAFRLRAGELAGRCLLDLGRFDEAAEVLRDALAAPDLMPSAAIDLRYQLGLSLEAAGRGPEALAEFERVYAAQANYPDVALKIRLLRKAEAA